MKCMFKYVVVAVVVCTVGAIALLFVFSGITLDQPSGQSSVMSGDTVQGAGESVRRSAFPIPHGECTAEGQTEQGASYVATLYFDQEAERPRARFEMALQADQAQRVGRTVVLDPQWRVYAFDDGVDGVRTDDVRGLYENGETLIAALQHGYHLMWGGDLPSNWSCETWSVDETAFEVPDIGIIAE